MTTASWIRQEVRSNPLYQENSQVTSEINFHLLKKVKDITNGFLSCPTLVGQI